MRGSGKEEPYESDESLVSLKENTDRKRKKNRKERKKKVKLNAPDIMRNVKILPQ